MVLAIRIRAMKRRWRIEDVLSNAVFADIHRAVMGLHDHATARDVVRVLSGWVAKYPELTTTNPFSNYGFHSIGRVARNFELYAPVKLDDRAIGRIKTSFARLSRSNEAGIAQFVRDLMEELLAPEVDVTCAACGEDFMQAFRGERTSRLVLQCLRCGHIQFDDGSDARGETIRFLAAQEIAALTSLDWRIGTND